MDSGKSLAGKQSKPSHFDAAPRGATAKHRFITPEPGMSLPQLLHIKKPLHLSAMIRRQQHLCIEQQKRFP
jgi:hypothetical protein